MIIKHSCFSLIILILLLLSCTVSSGESNRPTYIEDFFANEIILTEAENNWLEQNPVVRARVGNNPPLHFYEDGNYGVSVDYLTLIAEHIGFRVEFVNGIPWTKALENIQIHEAIDLVLTAKNTKERQKTMLFSDDYLMMPWVIFSRTDADFISSIEDLFGKTVAVEQGFVMQKRLMKEFSAINLLVKKHSAESLESVASGEAEAYIGNLATSTYIINKYNLTNLKVASPAPFDNHNQAFVVRNDWPELKSILNKAIKATPPSTLSGLRNKWFNVQFEYGISKSTFRNWIGAILGFSLAAGLFFSYWIFALRKQITKRKIAEQERNELQQRLQQAQKMEAIGTLAGGIAHDFNNLLSVIIGYADLAKEDAPPGEQYEADLNEISVAASRARDLVKQILTFSRQTDVEPIQMQMQPLLKEALRLLRSSIPTTISIMEDIGPANGTIMADPSQIHQVMMNLCTNAYHAMENTGGTLSVSLHTVSVGPEEKRVEENLPPGEYIHFTVADTGQGIGPEVIGKIFDPFFTTKETGKGTGMGLAISHGIIKECGGVITVDSKLGTGTAFKVYIPTVKDDGIAVVEENEEIPKGNERLLLVDDEVVLADMAKDMLERLGYSVTVRYSSLKALETFKNNPDAFDLVITDQTMPEMTGTDLARSLLGIEPKLPIILCTGYSTLVDKDSSKQIGIKQFVLKPLTRRSICSAYSKCFR